jgi:hypothetical protein
MSLYYRTSMSCMRISSSLSPKNFSEKFIRSRCIIKVTLCVLNISPPSTLNHVQPVRGISAICRCTPRAQAGARLGQKAHIGQKAHLGHTCGQFCLKCAREVSKIQCTARGGFAPNVPGSASADFRIDSVRT